MKRLSTNYRMIRLMIAFCCLFTLNSCNNVKYDDLNKVTITGNCQNLLTESERRQIERIDLTIQNSSNKKVNKLNKRSYNIKIYISIDSTLHKNHYLNPVKNCTEGLLTIEVYKNPRIIKGAIMGDNRMDLQTIIGRDYYNIQASYYQSGDITKAIVDMTQLLFENYNKKLEGKRKYKTGFLDWIEKPVNYLIGFIKPRDNIIGRLFQPLWAISNYIISSSDSLKHGLFVIISSALFIFFMLFIPLKDSIDDGSDGKKWFIIMDILKVIFLILLIIYTYYIYTPNIENTLALSEIYDLDTSKLNQIYRNYTPTNHSIFISIITVIIFLLNYLYKKIYENEMLKIIKSGKEENDRAEEAFNFGMIISSFILFCAIFDNTIIIAILVYFIINLIENLFRLKVIWRKKV